MRIDVNISINKDFMEGRMPENSSKVASGWVEIENAIKFPVQILKTEKDGRESTFVRFPSKRNEDGTYSNIVFPVDAEVREKIISKVMDTFKREVVKGIDNPEISDVRVTLLPEKERTEKVVSRAMASIKICGIVVNDFVVKETEDNFFVQPPQYQDKEGHFRETFYGTNKRMQIQISNTILEAYENLTKELKKNATVEQEATRKTDLEKSETDLVPR